MCGKNRSWKLISFDIFNLRRLHSRFFEVALLAVHWLHDHRKGEPLIFCYIVLSVHRDSWLDFSTIFSLVAEWITADWPVRTTQTTPVAAGTTAAGNSAGRRIAGRTKSIRHDRPIEDRLRISGSDGGFQSQPWTITGLQWRQSEPSRAMFFFTPWHADRLIYRIKSDLFGLKIISNAPKRTITDLLFNIMQRPVD